MNECFVETIIRDLCRIEKDREGYLQYSFIDVILLRVSQFNYKRY